jgi:hypothetical protein
MSLEPHAQRAHARLAPSAAHRWMECSGSVRMEAELPEQQSSYAAEGTAAHELAAHCLRNDLDPVDFVDTVIDLGADGPGAMFNNRGIADGIRRHTVTEEMAEAVAVYLDVVRSLFGKARDRLNPNIIVDVEQRLDMRHLHPEIFGTGDAVVYQKTTGWLHVIDFKYGKGVVVSPEGNPQLMLYGAGAARRYGQMPINGITLHIVQPRAAGSPVKEWRTDVVELLEFEDEIRAAARATEKAAEMFSQAMPTPWHRSYLAAGDHCRFCKAAGTCPALRERAQKAALAEFQNGEGPLLPPPDILPPEKLADVLFAADMIGNWVKAVQAYAHEQAMAGNVPPGWKLVPKRAIRRWRDEAEFTDRVLVDFPELTKEDLYAEPKLKSPAQIEKTVGKKAFADLEDLVVKESSGLNLVSISDARAPAKTAGLLDFDARDVET